MDENITDHAKDIVRIEGGREVFPVTIDCLGEASIQNDAVVYLLPVITDEQAAKRFDFKTKEMLPQKLTVRGLVLGACDSSKTPPHLRRIGSFALYSSSDDNKIEDLCKDFMNLFKKEDSSMTAIKLAQGRSVSTTDQRRRIIVIHQVILRVLDHLKVSVYINGRDSNIANHHIQIFYWSRVYVE